MMPTLERPIAAADAERIRGGARRLLLAAPITLTLLACCLAAFAVPELAVAMQWDREAMADGQWWRLVTGHLTHWDADHLFWDAAVFVVLGWIAERRSRRRFLACLAASCLAIPAGIWLFEPAITTYRGLSGLDTALFTLLATELLPEGIRRGRQVGPWDRLAGVMPAALLLGLIAKIAYEYATGQTLFVNSAASGFTPVPLAHLIGAVVGFVLAAAGKLAAHAAFKTLTGADDSRILRGPSSRFPSSSRLRDVRSCDGSRRWLHASAVGGRCLCRRRRGW
ncbi:MAG: rhombosortase [Planctomycetes bacterium]|nr:rhombosortase [Planctomycetota bacterium]